MAVKKAGIFHESSSNGYYLYGTAGAGSIVIDDGSVLHLEAIDAASEPKVRIGLNGGTGTGLITGSGSGLILTSQGSVTAKISVHVGQGSGSMGALELASGAALFVQDLVGTTGSGDGGGESVRIGLGGGAGTVSASASTMTVRGSGASFEIGVSQGTGTTRLDSGSILKVISETGEAGDIAELVVGGNSGSGVLDVDASSVKISATGESAASILVGFGGIGDATVSGSGLVTISGHTAILSVGDSATAGASLEVLTGAAVKISDAGGALEGPMDGAGSVFAVGFGTRTEPAHALISGATSHISVDDLAIVGGKEVASGQLIGSGNGTLTILQDGTLEAGAIKIGPGGTLVTGYAKLDAEETGVHLEGGTWDVLSGVQRIVGGFTSKAGTINFHFDAQTHDAGRTFVTSGDIAIDQETEINILIENGYISAGTRYKFISVGESVAYDIPAAVNVLGQSDEFAYAIARDRTGLFIAALNRGNGSGTSVIDFGSAVYSAATFTLNGDTGIGTGTGGVYGDVRAMNVEGAWGTRGRDSFVGTGGTGVSLGGRDGNDTLTGASGDDSLSGGSDHDLLYGGGGDDRLFGGSGNDTLIGGPGADRLDGSIGENWVCYEFATSGARRISLRGSPGEGGESQGDVLLNILNVRGSVHADLFVGDSEANRFTGLGGDDMIIGEAGNDTLDGGSGDDVVNGGAGADSIIGGSGVDTVRYASSSSVSINLAANTAVGGQAEGDVFFGIENVVASQEADTIVGNGQPNRIEGLAGDDHMRGGMGADTILGREGSDTASYQDGSVGIRIGHFLVGSGGTAEGDRLVQVERLLGSGHDDILVGGGWPPFSKAGAATTF